MKGVWVMTIDEAIQHAFEEFVDYYGFEDGDQVYTSGTMLIPVFRVKQWLENIEQKDTDEYVLFNKEKAIRRIKEIMKYNTDNFGSDIVDLSADIISAIEKECK